MTLHFTICFTIFHKAFIEDGALYPENLELMFFQLKIYPLIVIEVTRYGHV